MPKPKKQRGGARPGAGRPRLKPEERSGSKIGVWIPRAVRAAIEAEGAIGPTARAAMRQGRPDWPWFKNEIDRSVDTEPKRGE